MMQTLGPRQLQILRVQSAIAHVGRCWLDSTTEAFSSFAVRDLRVRRENRRVVRGALFWG